MTSCHIKLIILLTLLNFLKSDNPNGDNDNKFNVVLFLAKTTTSQNYLQDAGIKMLNFVEKNRVKHCTPSCATEELESFTSPGSDCKQLLKGSIVSLISYCRSMLGMTTAIASIENDTFSNGLRFKKSTSEDFEIRYHNPRTIRGRPNQIKNAKPDFITKPEHTEVFKIRSKREYHTDDYQNVEAPLGEEVQNNKWDIFGIVANVKLTFFGKLFDGDKHRGGPPSAPNNVIDQLGTVSENTFFELVKETLTNVQGSCESGFLMIVLGGFLGEICDVYSGLMQSVKHVVENTDQRNTLIVVTGSCPILDRPTGDEEQYLIPVYVRAPPKAGSISISSQLYDVPYAIKNLLLEMNGASYFASVNTKRSKRNTLKVRGKRNSAGTTRASMFLLCLLYLLSN